MNCLVTAGPTCEPLDQVRRLTNASTGRLGVELANYLVDRGHVVSLLLGALASWAGPCRANHIERFTTVADLHQRLQQQARKPVDAVFHAAAVSDFRFGHVFEQPTPGELRLLETAKYPTRSGVLLAELVPTRKLIAELRTLFPGAFLAGWKFEVDGTRHSVIQRCLDQLCGCNTDVCVANGPAYGPGYGIVTPGGEVVHAADAAELYARLERRLHAQ
ncbi:MAG: DNA/pantothenate metabolism flavoprotein domain protein [Verrucomicrobia bacterium]|nr:DNA/pantothenate metabolism flavoprotein domain protein [Verrucomicrobiota bacterium]OQC66301.1 MAG: Coenzyme A biosynthesis bifunctional protein CoaBC [Verrucomicrobia bacterium ADurb.Bin006]MDI9382112.1 phosphopantothenoylcysteine decarboxylase [Verrucomicrobiota bacterium]NMD20026.1 phosphopantothenoylcysteine decarboxylase [Verrucomicrobiota bacterium]HNU99133.1 phosphopantothenoylcysteine decarboxylase [Verrucomicrobiota bacterium]